MGNSTSIRLTWSPPLLPYGVLISYTITYNVSDGNISTVINSTNPRSHLIAQLEEHTWYRFELFASTSVGSGPHATLITRTDIAGTQLSPIETAVVLLLVKCSMYDLVCSTEPHAPPTSITVEVDGSTQATISWLPPPYEDQNGPIIYYNLIVSDLNFGLNDIDVNTSSTSYTITNLEEYNNYSFIVAAATEAGVGHYSLPIKFTTEEDCELGRDMAIL